MLSSKAARGLTLFRLFLVLLPLILLSLDIARLTYLRAPIPTFIPTPPRVITFYALLITPDTFAFFLYIILITTYFKTSTRQTLRYVSSISLHRFCRILSSLTLVGFILYDPIREIIDLSEKIDQWGQDPTKKDVMGMRPSFQVAYSCSNVPAIHFMRGTPDVYQQCIQIRVRSILAFVLGVAALVELGLGFKLGEFKHVVVETVGQRA